MFTEALYQMSSAIGHSMLYSAAAAGFLIYFGFVFAYLAEREGARWLDLVLLITFGIPSTVLGIALIRFFNTTEWSFIYTGVWVVLIGYVGRFLFITQKLIANAMKQIPVSLEEAAQLSGAGFALRIRKILLPLLSPGILAAFVIAFIFTLGELGTTILVYPPGTSVMPVKVYTIMANAPQSLTSAMSLIVLLITLGALSLLYFGHRYVTRKKWSPVL